MQYLASEHIWELSALEDVEGSLKSCLEVLYAIQTRYSVETWRRSKVNE